MKICVWANLTDVLTKYCCYEMWFYAARGRQLKGHLIFPIIYRKVKGLPMKTANKLEFKNTQDTNPSLTGLT